MALPRPGRERLKFTAGAARAAVGDREPGVKEDRKKGRRGTQSGACLEALAALSVERGRVPRLLPQGQSWYGNDAALVAPTGSKVMTNN